MTASTDESTTCHPGGDAGLRWYVAGMDPRLSAALLDGLASTLIGFLPAMLLLALIGKGTGTPPGDLRFEFAMGLGTWIGATAYIGLLEARRGPKNGQTPGKRSQGIRTVRVDGGLPISPARALARAALLGLVFPFGLPLGAVLQAVLGAGTAGHDLNRGLLLAVGGLAVAVAALGRRRRTPFDWLTGTVVVNDYLNTTPAAERPRRAPSGSPNRGAEADSELVRPLPTVGLPVDVPGAAIALAVAGIGVWGLINRIG